MLSGPGTLSSRFDADEQPQRRIALEFVEAGVGGDVPQGDGQDERAPEDLDGIVVAPLAAGRPERLEEWVIGDGFEEDADGLQRGGIFESVPGEQRLGDGDFHGVVRGSGGGMTGDLILLRKRSPRRWTAGRRIVKMGLPEGKGQRIIGNRGVRRFSGTQNRPEKPGPENFSRTSSRRESSSFVPDSGCTMR